MQIPENNTILLKGLFFSQVRTLEERMLEENIAQLDNDALPLADRHAALRVADIRVTRFRGKKQWAESYKDVTLKCWYCGLSFKGLPCFIPRQIRNTPTGKEYDTHGLFCGFACAFSFLKNQAEFVRNRTYFDKLSMLKMLFTEFYSRKTTEFKEAPNLYDLAFYGGHLDIVDYRNNLRSINADIISQAKHTRP